MKLTKDEMLTIVRRQLAVDMNCKEEDFLLDGVTFCRSAINDGRRMFTRQTPYVEAASMGRGIVVSADALIMEKVKSVLAGKARDDLFFAPFFYGHSLYYIPDATAINAFPVPDGYALRIVEGEDVFGLYEAPGFRNALSYDRNHPRPDVIAACAIKAGKIVGMAGASEDSKTMWQVGIDVLPEYRNRGLACCLVSRLAQIILERGIVPYYGTASSNIASQSVAHRSGFMPAWMCTYRNTFDGNTPSQTNRDKKQNA